MDQRLVDTINNTRLRWEEYVRYYNPSDGLDDKGRTLDQAIAEDVAYLYYERS